MRRTQLANDKEATGDRQQNAIQDISRKTAVAVNQLGATPVYIGPFTFAAGQNRKLDHGLGRQPTEWIITDCVVGYPLFYRVKWDDKTITLHSDNNSTIMLRIA